MTERRRETERDGETDGEREGARDREARGEGDCLRVAATIDRSTIDRRRRLESRRLTGTARAIRSSL